MPTIFYVCSRRINHFVRRSSNIFLLRYVHLALGLWCQVSSSRNAKLKGREHGKSSAKSSSIWDGNLNVKYPVQHWRAIQFKNDSNNISAAWKMQSSRGERESSWCLKFLSYPPAVWNENPNFNWNPRFIGSVGGLMFSWLNLFCFFEKKNNKLASWDAINLLLIGIWC